MMRDSNIVIVPLLLTIVLLALLFHCALLWAKTENIQVLGELWKATLHTVEATLHTVEESWKLAVVIFFGELLSGVFVGVGICFHAVSDGLRIVYKDSSIEKLVQFVGVCVIASQFPSIAASVEKMVSKPARK